VLDGSAAQGQNQSVCLDLPGNGRLFPVAESRLAITGEKFGDRHPGFSDDYVIGIDKLPSEPRGQEWAGGAFPRTHEPCQDDAPHRAGCALDGFGLRIRLWSIGHKTRWCLISPAAGSMFKDKASRAIGLSPEPSRSLPQ
jgi:hypothetical protein